MRLLDKIKNRLTGASLGNEASLALVNEELSQGIKQDDIWEMAEGQCSGDVSLTKLVYTKMRAEQLQKQADEKIAVIKEESREIERRKVIAEREIEAIYQRDLAEQTHITSIEEAKHAIQFLRDRGYIIRKYNIGKKATHWDIENGSFFYKARSPQDIVKYAEQVKLSIKLGQVPFQNKT
jgi:hypothetical protein